mmetsp:Transcript_42129/g.137224  ORF Transcript_42129/g.137224 Transcript_42129/m.137224 type:complete len:202 (+) Transcript_42129:387-992(+)
MPLSHTRTSATSPRSPPTRSSPSRRRREPRWRCPTRMRGWSRGSGDIRSTSSRRRGPSRSSSSPQTRRMARPAARRPPRRAQPRRSPPPTAARRAARRTARAVRTARSLASLTPRLLLPQRTPLVATARARRPVLQSLETEYLWTEKCSLMAAHKAEAVRTVGCGDRRGWGALVWREAKSSTSRDAGDRAESGSSPCPCFK